MQAFIHFGIIIKMDPVFFSLTHSPLILFNGVSNKDLGILVFFMTECLTGKHQGSQRTVNHADAGKEGMNQKSVPQIDQVPAANQNIKKTSFYINIHFVNLGIIADDQGFIHDLSPSSILFWTFFTAAFAKSKNPSSFLFMHSIAARYVIIIFVYFAKFYGNIVLKNVRILTKSVKDFFHTMNIIVYIDIKRIGED